MVFEFTGETPTLGSAFGTLGAFPTASQSPLPSTHARVAPTTSFARPGFATSSGDLPHPQPPPPTTVAAAVLNTTLPDRKGSEDALSRALHRAKVNRPAVFGDAEIAADSLLAGYLEDTYAHTVEGCNSLRDLVQALAEVAKSNPEAMRFVRHLFEQITATRNTARAQMYDGPEENDHDKASHTGEGSDIVVNKDEYGRPFSFPALPRSEQFFQELHRRTQLAMTSHRWLERSGDPGPMLVTRALDNGQNKDEVLNILWLHGYGGSLPGQAPSQAQVEFVDDLYEETLKVYQDYKTGWTVEGKDTMSYFGAGGARTSGSRRTVYWAKEDEEGKSCCGTKASATAAVYRKEYAKQPFDFMGLPPELRTRVYDFALAPGAISLRSCTHHMPRGTVPALAPGLLSTSRQLKQEAETLLESNTFVVNLYLQSGYRSVIHRSQLPPNLLPKVTSLTFVIDVVSIESGLVDYRDYHDWRQLQALTSLTHLRITGLDRRDTPSTVTRWCEILGQIVKRVPAGCTIKYGAESDLELDHIRDMAESIENDTGRWIEPAYAVRGVKEVDLGTLKSAAKTLPASVVPGAMSGQVTTAFWRLGSD